MTAGQPGAYAGISAAPIGSSGAAADTRVGPDPRFQRRPRRRTWPAVVVLYLFAALIPESIATGNTQVAAYVVAPATLPFLAAFYGGAAVAIRELRLRCGLGWSGVGLLGVAFGFANEGVIAATWYRVAPTGYTFVPGRAGVDVAWAVFLTVFHVVVSVVIPILLVEAAFPGIAGQRWVGRPGMTVSVGLPLLLTAVTLLSPTYRPQRLVVVAAIAGLITLALRRRTQRSIRSVPRAGFAGVGRLRWVGAGLMVAFFANGSPRSNRAKRGRRVCGLQTIATTS